jgi:predicted lipoprotein with Yx(FWY)xxD motif
VNGKTFAIAVLALLAIVVTGCGSSGGSTSGEGGNEGSGYSSKGGGAYGGGQETAGSENGGEAAVVSLGNVSKLGMVLVDSNGLTLYDFHKDKGGASACYGACAEGWPPLITEGEPQVGNGASAARLGTTERKDGSLQVTYAGHPLYTYVVDKKPGEANGNDVNAFGGQWYALKGNGEEAND